MSGFLGQSKMNTSEAYAKRACDLGIPLVEAESTGIYGDELRKYNLFVKLLNTEMREGTLNKVDAALAMIIIQTCGFYSTYKQGKVKDIRRRMDTARKAINTIELPLDQTSILLKILDIVENDVCDDASNVVPRLTAKERNAPEYLLRLYVAISRYRIK